MSVETRLYMAVSGARERMQAGTPANVAAAALSHLLDVPHEDVLRLATLAETECARVRAELAIEHERRARELERARERASAQPEAMP
jgi:hypothetical protein